MPLAVLNVVAMVRTSVLLIPLTDVNAAFNLER